MPDPEKNDEPKRISAYDFAEKVRFGFRSGISAKRTAESLRSLADSIESGQCLVQSGMMYNIAEGKDFVRSVMIIKFNERRDGHDGDTR